MAAIIVFLSLSSHAAKQADMRMAARNGGHSLWEKRYDLGGDCRWRTLWRCRVHAVEATKGAVVVTAPDICRELVLTEWRAEPNAAREKLQRSQHTAIRHQGESE